MIDWESKEVRQGEGVTHLSLPLATVQSILVLDMLQSTVFRIVLGSANMVQ